MTIKELIKRLKQHPEDMEVVLPVSYGDYYGPPEPFVQKGTPNSATEEDYLVLGG